MESSSNLNSVTSETYSQAGEEVKKMEDQSCVQVLEDYKLELAALMNKVTKMSLEIQDLKKKKGEKEDKAGSSNKGAAKVSGKKQGPRVSNDGTKCGLCKKMKELGIKPKDSKHHLTMRGYVEPESCGYLRDLNVQEMAELFKEYEMCRVCAYRPISDAHHEDKCNYTRKVTLAKCQVKNCGLRYFLCAEHVTENNGQIRNRMEYYKEQKFPAFNFPLGLKKGTGLELKQKETRGTQTEDSNLPNDAMNYSPVIKADQDVSSDSVPANDIESETDKKDVVDLPGDLTTAFPVAEERRSDSSPVESMTNSTDEKNSAASNLQMREVN